MSDSGLYPHRRAALVAGGIAFLGITALILAAYVPTAAIVVGSTAGCPALWAGYHWLRRKLGVKSSGRRWRMPRPRPGRSTSSGKRPGLGRRSGPELRDGSHLAYLMGRACPGPLADRQLNEIAAGKFASMTELRAAEAERGRLLVRR